MGLHFGEIPLEVLVVAMPGCGAHGRWRGLAGLAQRPGPTGVEGAGGICCSARGRCRGLAGLRPNAPSHTSAHQVPLVWTAPEASAAVPVGGGRARAGLEIDHSERSSRVAISRAGRRPPAHTAAGPHKAARPRSRIRRHPEHQRAPDNGYDSETSPRGSRRDRPR